jgi:porin
MMRMALEPRRHAAIRIGVAAFSIVIGLSNLARAQESPDKEAPASTVNVGPWATGESVPAWTKFGQDLTDDGIYITGRLSGQLASNPIGGQQQRTAYTNEIVAGVTLDMDKIAGISGGSLHVLFNERFGNSLSADAINTDLSTQYLYGAGQTTQLAVFTWEQKLFDNKVDINFGRTDIAFLTSPYFCDFQSHGDCGRPYGLARMTSASVYPEAVWGGRALWDITPNFYAKAGVYQPNPGLVPQQTNGFDWRISSKLGVVLPAEFGYKYFSPGATIPNLYGVGVVYSHAPYTVPFLPNTNLEDRSALYVIGQQTIWQPGPGSRGISLFGMVLHSNNPDIQTAVFQDSVGLIWQGPTASRPRDRFGIMFNDYQLSDQYLSFLTKERLKAGSTDVPYKTQQTIEVNYNFQINRWLQLMPNIQYVRHPDGLGATLPYPTHNLHDAWVFGLQLDADLAALVGIPSYPISKVLDN